MVRVIVISVCLSLASLVCGQTDQYLHPGTLEASATISGSSMLARGESNMYISGYAEYHMDYKVSFRGDTYLFAAGQSESPFINEAFRTYFGLFYHFNKHNFDYSIGFQPGITYMKKNIFSDDTEPVFVGTEQKQLMPSFAITTGASYYVWKYFNIFANVTYVRSNLSGTSQGTFNTDELMISAGLGFQINTRKSK